MQQGACLVGRHMPHLIHHICCALVDAREIVACRRHSTNGHKSAFQRKAVADVAWACADRGGSRIVSHVVCARVHDLALGTTWLCTTPPLWVASSWRLRVFGGMNMPIYQMLNPSDAMHARWRLTSSSHFRADSPCSSTLWPNRRKQSSRAALVSGHAQQLGVSCKIRTV